MIALRIEVPELDTLKRLFREAPAYVTQEMHAAAQDAVDLTVEEVKARTPHGESGRLELGLRGAVRGFGDSTRGVVRFEGVPYAEFVEEDTPAHDIVPVRKKALRFAAGGRTVFARRVHHPGTRGQHMLRDGWEAAQPRIVERYQVAVRRVADRLGRAGK